MTTTREVAELAAYGVACDRGVGVRVRDQGHGKYVELGMRELDAQGAVFLFVGITPASARSLATSLRNAAAAAECRGPIEHPKLYTVPRTGAKVVARPSREEEAVEAMVALVAAARECTKVEDPRIFEDNRPRAFDNDLAEALRRLDSL